MMSNYIKNILAASFIALAGLSSCQKDNADILTPKDGEKYDVAFRVMGSIEKTPIYEYSPEEKRDEYAPIESDEARGLIVEGILDQDQTLQFGISRWQLSVAFCAFGKDTNGNYEAQTGNINRILGDQVLDRNKNYGTGLMLLKDNVDENVGGNDNTIAHRLYYAYHDREGHGIWSPRFKPDNTYVFTAIGGLRAYDQSTHKSRSRRYYGYSGDQARNIKINPNRIIYELHNSDAQGVPFPIVSKAKRVGTIENGVYKGVVTKAENGFHGATTIVDFQQDFKARGCIAGFQFFSQTGTMVKLYKLQPIFNDTNMQSPFYYGGYFDPSLVDTSNKDLEYEVPFVGEDDMPRGTTFDFCDRQGIDANGNPIGRPVLPKSPMYKPAKLAKDTNYKEIYGPLNHRAIFPMWGMPREGREEYPLRIRVQFKKVYDNGTEGPLEWSKPIRIEAPLPGFQTTVNGWRDGNLHRMYVPIYSENFDVPYGND